MLMDSGEYYLDGMPHEEAEEKCKNTIKLLGLDHRIGHKPNELSGGQ